MAKFFGKIGYVISVEDSPSIWVEKSIVKEYYGEVLKNISRWKEGDKINDDISIQNTISIVADPFAYQYFSSIRWVEWMSAKWKVNSIEVDYPRLKLNLGGVYNDGDESSSP